MADQITREEFADHMDGFEQRLGARTSRTDRRLETIDSRLDALDGRLDAIDTRLDVIDGRLRVLSERADSQPAGDANQAPPFPADATRSEAPLTVLGVMAVAAPLEPDGVNGDLASVPAGADATRSTLPSRKTVLRKANGATLKPARGRPIVGPATRTRQRRKP